VPKVEVAPASRAGWVIVGSQSDLLAFRLDDGTLVWRQALGASLHASVAIDGDHVYAPLSDGSIAALDITNGKTIWHKKTPAAAGAITVAGDRLYFGSDDKFFYSLDAKDGDRNWRWRAAAALVAPVAVDEERVYYTALDNVVRAVDAGSGVQKWRYPMETRPIAGPILDDQLVIVATARDLLAIRVADGTLAGKVGVPSELASVPVLAPLGTDPSGTRAVIVTGADTGDWRVYGLAPSAEPTPTPLKEIPGRPLPPDVPPGLPEPPTPGVPRLP
jgi:outer membrane protein assembly factor BamB